MKDGEGLCEKCQVTHAFYQQEAKENKATIRELVEALKDRISKCCEPDGSPDQKFSYCDDCKENMVTISKATNEGRG